MKRILSVILSVLLVLPIFVIGVSGESENKKISIEFRSDIAGLDYTDVEKLAVINSDNISYNSSRRFSPLQINDYTGDVYLDKLKPGRTYYFTYSFEAINGYEIPASLDESDVDFTCGKGTTVIWYHRSQGTSDTGEKCYFFDVYTKVTVDGNFFQLLFGKIIDFFNKLTAWSPY